MQYALTKPPILSLQNKARELEEEFALGREGAAAQVRALNKRAEDAEAAAAAARRETMAVREEAAGAAAAHAEAIAEVEGRCNAFQVRLCFRTHCRYMVRTAAGQRQRRVRPGCATARSIPLHGTLQVCWKWC